MSRPYLPLKGRSEFRRVFRRGARSRSGGVTVICAAAEPGPARIGVVAGRSVGNAVMRNRTKRRLREAIALATMPEGVACVVVASPEVATAPLATVVEWVERGLERSGGDGGVR